ncbi:MAG: DUF1573 domain-containing protein [Bacteroidales bacterium]
MILKKNHIKLLFLCVLYCITTIAYAQQPEIEMNKRTHDFGEEFIPIYFPPASFKFTNTGNAPLAILTTNSAYEVKVQFERTYIFPGETGVIYVDYQSQELGPFNEKIEVYTNASDEPFYLRIKGNNISVNECYPNKRNREMRKVVTVDAVTKEPIPKTDVFFYFQQRQEIADQTDKEGEVVMTLPIGIYDIKASHEKYHPFAKNMFIPKSKPIIIIELQPKDEIEEMLADVEVDIPPIRSAQSKPPQQEQAFPTSSRPQQAKNTANPGELSTIEYAPNNIIFLIDISLSMKINNRMDKLKKSLSQVISVLRDIDTISLIAYNQESYVLLNKTTGAHKENIKGTIDTLTPDGLTDGVRGLETAYEIARSGYIHEGNNQLILATDGEFSGSKHSEPVILKLVHEHAKNNIPISIISFGNDRKALFRLRRIAFIGKGSYIHITSTEESPDIILEEVKARSKKML